MARGIDILIKVNDTVVALQKGASLNRSAETIDVTTKTSYGWKEFISSLKEWSIECDGLYTLPTASGTSGFRELENAFVNSIAVTVEFALIDDTGLTVGDTSGFTGEAYIVDFPIEAPMDDAVTFSVTLQGTGALSEVLKA